MAATIGALSVALAMDSAAFTAGTARARRELASFSAQTNTALAAMDRAFTRTSASVGTLVARYTSWAAVSVAVQRTMRESIRVNDVASKSWDRLSKSASGFANSLGPLFSAAMDQAAWEIERTTQDIEALKRAFDSLGGNKGVTIPMGVSPLQPGYNVSASLGKDGNWTPSPGGFPVSGVTDLTPGIKAATEAAEDRAKTIRDLEAGTAKFMADLQKKIGEDIHKNIEAEMDFRSQMYLERIERENDTFEAIRDIRDEEARQLQEALDYGAQLQKEYADKFIEDQRRAAEAVKASYQDIEFAIRDLVNYGITDLKRLGDAIFTILGKQMPGGLGKALAGATTGLGIGSSFGTPIGGGIGGAIGSLIGGPIGSIAGSLIGSGIGKLIQGKPSDMRSVATFGPGGSILSVGAESAHEYSAESVGAAQQAAGLIAEQMQALAAMGVQFTQQLASISIGARDASTYQLVGGQRISAGTVGDPMDLAADALAAILKGATSSDPTVSAMLAKGGSSAEIMQALEFAQGITDALAQITDPMEYALSIWERTARANLAMAEQTGFSLDKVREYNAALYQQTVAQINAPALAGLDSFSKSLLYGSGSAMSPQAQVTAAFADYDAARQAALANPTAQTAAAFVEAAQAYLPIARSHFGTSTTYGAIVDTALSAAEQIRSGLAVPSVAPDLQPLVQATMTTGAATVSAVNDVSDRLDRLESTLTRFGANIEAVVRRLEV